MSARRDRCRDGGASTLLAEASGPAVVVPDGSDARVVHETDDGHGPRLRAVGPDGSGGTDLGAVPDGLGLGALGSASGSGLRLPPGWVLLAPDGRLPLTAADPRPTLRHVPDGRSVQLDEVSR